METIGAFDAKTRLSELLERTAKGESFEITKHGRPVGKIVPPDTVSGNIAWEKPVPSLMVLMPTIVVFAPYGSVTFR